MTQDSFHLHSSCVQLRGARDSDSRKNKIAATCEHTPNPAMQVQCADSIIPFSWQITHVDRNGSLALCECLT